MQPNIFDTNWHQAILVYLEREKSVVLLMNLWYQWPTWSIWHHIQTTATTTTVLRSLVWFQKKHPLNHTYPDQQPSFISFLHLLRSIASFLFNLRAWCGMNIKRKSWPLCDVVRVNFCKSARLEPPTFQSLKAFRLLSSSPTFCHIQRLLRSCFLWCTKQEMTPNDIDNKQTTSFVRIHQ